MLLMAMVYTVVKYSSEQTDPGLDYNVSSFALMLHICSGKIFVLLPLSVFDT